jgi:hypothetical protein
MHSGRSQRELLMNANGGPRAAADQRPSTVFDRPAEDRTPAHLVIKGLRGLFVAEDCVHDAATVTAVGRERRRTGVNYSVTRWGARRYRTWPWSRIIEIRWQPGLGDKAAA